MLGNENDQYQEIHSLHVGILPFCRSCQFFWGWPERGFCQESGVFVDGLIHNCPDWTMRAAEEWQEDGSERIGVEEEKEGNNSCNGDKMKALLSSMVISTRVMVGDSRKLRRLKRKKRLRRT